MKELEFKISHLLSLPQTNSFLPRLCLLLIIVEQIKLRTKLYLLKKRTELYIQKKSEICYLFQRNKFNMTHNLVFKLV
ncbi:unnamed protein product [Coffea canephora]|uniref:Uncharacterized protein n=1 Tax=Coffea canephora TaxID=49390 RepID=A0A068U6J0_COFCA|nr:unnamed protein product [Coffea canephora]